jgi:hypothetical protein
MDQPQIQQIISDPRAIEFTLRNVHELRITTDNTAYSSHILRVATTSITEAARGAARGQVSLAAIGNKPQNSRRKRANKEEKLYTIEIGDTVIQYQAKDIIWPNENIQFVDDISRLFRDWENSSYVFLRGQPIALQYWGKLFGKGIDSKAWSIHKHSYSQWKVRTSLSFYD